jgi:hypothetical protein
LIFGCLTPEYHPVPEQVAKKQGAIFRKEFGKERKAFDFQILP